MDVEKYISGNATEAERRDLEAAMAADPALRAEVEMRQRLQIGFHELHLQNKVQQVAQARQAWLQRQWWRRIGGTIVLMLLLGIAVLLVLKKPVNSIDTKLPEPQRKEQFPEEKVQQAPPSSQKAVPVKPKSKIPIAEGPRIQNELSDQPLVRGVYEDLDTLTVNLIERLLNESAKNQSFENIAGWKKVIQLLREGKPIDANVLIFKMESNGGDEAIEARWLLGISLLAQGKTDEAKTVFEKIAHTNGHIRQELAKQALTTLQE